MKVISVPGQRLKPLRHPILAIGVFDGVHLGHQYLLRQALHRARRKQGQAIVMTFFPHPVHVLRPKVPHPLLTTLSERLELLEKLGVDVCMVVHFTKKFSRLSPKEFFDRFILDLVRPKEIFVGDDFRFGYERSGHLEFLKKIGGRFGMEVHIVPSLHKDNLDISSSLIRRLIAEGKLREAQKLLGRPVTVSAPVQKGDRRGKALGFPTANLHPRKVVLPPTGVYLTRVYLDGATHPAMTNVGVRPSFARRPAPVHVEVHILDFHRRIYRKILTVEFLRKIREEKKFSTVDHLIRQLEKDEKKIRRLLASSSSVKSPKKIF